MRFFGYLRYFFALKRPTNISPLVFSLYFLSTLHCSSIITALKVSPHPSFRVTHPSFGLASHAAFAHSCRLLQTLLLFRPHLSLQMTSLPNALKIHLASMISLHMCPSSFSFIPVLEDEVGPKASSSPWTSDFCLLSSSGPSSPSTPSFLNVFHLSAAAFGLQKYQPSNMRSCVTCQALCQALRIQGR